MILSPFIVIIRAPCKAIIPSGLTQEDVEARMRDPRYYDPARRDRGFVDQVNNDFKKLYG